MPVPRQGFHYKEPLVKKIKNNLKKKMQSNQEVLLADACSYCMEISARSAQGPACGPTLAYLQALTSAVRACGHMSTLRQEKKASYVQV